MLDQIKALWLAEPVRVVTALAAIIVFLAAKLGIVVDQQGVGEALLLVLPILLGGEGARAKVSPVRQETGQASDDLLDLDAIKEV